MITRSSRADGPRLSTSGACTTHTTSAASLQERASLLHHADFFVGLSSGLSWLAWALGRPVVMISGFTHPHNEFETPYRVINFHACNSCRNDTGIEFDHANFEFSRLITPRQVIRTVDQLIADRGLDPRAARRPS